MQVSNFGGTFDNFFFEYFYEILTEEASLLLLYHGAKKSKMTKNSNQGGPALRQWLSKLYQGCSWVGCLGGFIRVSGVLPRKLFLFQGS